MPGQGVAREMLRDTIRNFLGNALEVYGVTWRYMLFLMDGDAPGNTIPHMDSFSGWQLIISFTLQGTFELHLTKSKRLVAVGPKEKAGTCQAMLMAGAHSHENSMNPER
jgi:hypothetical protein